MTTCQVDADGVDWVSHVGSRWSPGQKFRLQGVLEPRGGFAVRAWAGGGLALRGSGPWFPRDDEWSSCLFTRQGLETVQRVSQ